MSSGGTAVPGTAPVREAHRFDVHALEAYLRDRLPGFAGPLEVRQFLGGPLILSGILKKYRDDVVAAARLPLVSEKEKGEWWAGTFSA